MSTRRTVNYPCFMTKTVKHDAKADYLLEQGMCILWTKGYNGTSVGDIVKAADVPKGSFYFYFDSKEDFALKALHKYENQYIQPAFTALQNKSIKAIDRMQAFYGFQIAMLQDGETFKHGCLGCNLSAELSEQNDRIREKVLHMHTSVKEQLVQVMLEAQADDDVPSHLDVPSLVEFISDAGKGVMLSMKETQSMAPVENMMRMLNTLFFENT